MTIDSKTRNTIKAVCSTIESDVFITNIVGLLENNKEEISEIKKDVSKYAREKGIVLPEGVEIKFEENEVDSKLKHYCGNLCVCWKGWCLCIEKK